MDSLKNLGLKAVAPESNERSSDAWVLLQYMTTCNPVTRAVEREILLKRLDRLVEDKFSFETGEKHECH